MTIILALLLDVLLKIGTKMGISEIVELNNNNGWGIILLLGVFIGTASELSNIFRKQ